MALKTLKASTLVWRTLRTTCPVIICARYTAETRLVLALIPLATTTTSKRKGIFRVWGSSHTLVAVCAGLESGSDVDSGPLVEHHPTGRAGCGSCKLAPIFHPRLSVIGSKKLESFGLARLGSRLLNLQAGTRTILVRRWRRYELRTLHLGTVPSAK
eukprot:scaffold14051_cov40-Prasinocladus_malaysianus.AAC.1